MLHTLLAKFTTLFAAAIVAVALTRGRWPERLAALIVVLDWIGGIVFQDRRLHHHGQPVMFACDCAQAAFFLVLACRCRRVWVLWAAALAALLALTHIVFMLNTAFGQWSYLTATYVWSLGLLVALGIGTVLEGQSPVGEAPSWSA